MGVYINPHHGGFEIEVDSKIYVDKSMLIKFCNESINGYASSRFMCVTRPRRTGKTMALDMLNAYYSKGSNSCPLFKNLKIKDDSSFPLHLNKHNVIRLDVNYEYLICDDKDNFVTKMSSRVVSELKANYPDVVFDSNNLADAIASIYEKREEKFIFLIDDWDTIFRKEEFNHKLINSYMNFLESLFKGGPASLALELVYMTGILPIKRFKTQSTLNMFKEFNMINPRNLVEFFGFTQNEVDELCYLHNMDKKEMRHWYNGYHYKNLDLYNPCSVVEAIQNKVFDDYWSTTSAREAITDYMNYDNGELKDTIAKMLVGEKISFDPSLFENDLTQINSKDAALTVLVHLGYLAYDEESKECYIPNYEISKEFVKATRDLKWNELNNPILESRKLVEETLKGNVEYINETLDRNHKELAGPFNKNKEDILGVVVSISYYYLKNNYNISKEESNTLGRADLIFHPVKGNNPAIIIELKVDASPEKAIEQIEEKGYTSSPGSYKGKVLLLGISYNSKTLKHSSKIKELFI